MHQLPRGKSSELAARSSAANPQIPLALAKQLKLLLGAKSNIFQVLNKHTIKMPNAQRRPHHTHSTYPSMAHTRREKKVDSVIFFEIYLHTPRRAPRRTFSFYPENNNGGAKPTLKSGKLSGSPSRSFREFENLS